MPGVSIPNITSWNTDNVSFSELVHHLRRLHDLHPDIIALQCVADASVAAQIRAFFNEYTFISSYKETLMRGWLKSTSILFLLLVGLVWTTDVIAFDGCRLPSRALRVYLWLGTAYFYYTFYKQTRRRRGGLLLLGWRRVRYRALGELPVVPLGSFLEGYQQVMLRDTETFVDTYILNAFLGTYPVTQTALPPALLQIPSICIFSSSTDQCRYIGSFLERGSWRMPNDNYTFTLRKTHPLFGCRRARTDLQTDYVLYGCLWLAARRALAFPLPILTVENVHTASHALLCSRIQE